MRLNEVRSAGSRFTYPQSVGRETVVLFDDILSAASRVTTSHMADYMTGKVSRNRVPVGVAVDSKTLSGLRTCLKSAREQSEKNYRAVSRSYSGDAEDIHDMDVYTLKTVENTIDWLARSNHITEAVSPTREYFLNESVSDALVRDLFRFSAKSRNGLVKIESEPISCNYMSSPATPIFYLDGSGVSRGQFILSASPGTRNSRFVFLCGFSEDGDRYYQKVKEIGTFDLASDDNFFGSREIASLVKTLIRVLAVSAKRRDNALVFDRSLAANFNRIFSGYTLGESAGDGINVSPVVERLCKKIPRARDLFLQLSVVQTKRGRNPEWGVQWKMNADFHTFIVYATRLYSPKKMTRVKPYFDSEQRAEREIEYQEERVDKDLSRYGFQKTRDFIEALLTGDREANWVYNDLSNGYF